MTPLFVEIDIVERLSLADRRRFESRTGLLKAPVTLILPSDVLRPLEKTLEESTVVVVFLHGLGGRRDVWGIPSNGNSQEGLASQIMHPLWLEGQRAVGLALAGMGHDGSELSPAWEAGLTPENYANQLEETLKSLGLLEGKRLILIGHSLGAAAAWEFGSRVGKLGKIGHGLRDMAILALSPVRGLAESSLLTFGCRLSGAVLSFCRRFTSLFHPLTEPVTKRTKALAAALLGLARQGRPRASLERVKGLVVVGQCDWVARRGLMEALRRARSTWPVAIIPKVGHNLLSMPTLGLILTTYISKFLRG